MFLMKIKIKNKKMIKQSENSQDNSKSSIKAIKIDKKKYLYSSSYENVVKVLIALRDYISNINSKNNTKALEELDWVINIITNHLLYNFQKTVFYKNNLDLINGSHKIADFSNEMEKYNKEYEELCKKFTQFGIKNEEFSKSLNFIEKNISLISNARKINNYSFNYQSKIKSVGIMENKKRINNNVLSQFPLHLLNDYNKNISDSYSINNIYSTDFSGIKSANDRNNLNNIISYKKNRVKELSIESQSSKNNANNKNLLFNNYRIYSTANSNVKNKINNKSFPKKKKIRTFGENNIVNNINNQQLEKIISLPIIQFNFNGGVNIDKYKINLFKKIPKLKNKKSENEPDNQNLVTFGKEIIKNIPKLPPHLTSGIDINSLFDFKNFDIFNLRDKLGLDNVMPFLGKEIIKKIDIIHLLDESKVDNFLMVLSKTYQNTRALYHTSLHGVDVCYSTLLILMLLRNDENNIIPDISELDIVSLIISTLAHDVGHPGLNNNYFINSKNELSIIYNDVSVLENFHCAKTFQMLENDEINIFSKFSKEEFTSLRKKMISEILATDMAFHFKIVDEYKKYKQNRDKKLEQNQLNFIIHIADLFHNYRKFEISLKWVELLINEFWKQGDKEKELKLPVSFLCDRENFDVPKSQVGFLTTFSLPTIQELIDINSKFEFLKENAIRNRSIWEKFQKEKKKRGWTPEKQNKVD